MNRIIEQELFQAVGEYLADQRPATFDGMERAYHNLRASQSGESAAKGGADSPSVRVDGD